MGTLSLVWGIIFIVVGLYFLAEGIAWAFIIAILYSGLGILAIIPGILLISIGGTLVRKYDRDKKKLDKYSCPYCNYVGTSEGELQKHNPKKHIQKSAHTWHFYVGIWLLIIAGIGVFVLFFLYDNNPENS